MRMKAYNSYPLLVSTLSLMLPISLSMEGMKYSGMKDFCLQDGFEATCADDEVVVIAGARYGRMRLSTCVTRDYGFVGCGNDVTRLLTNLCSGKRACRITNLEGIFTGPQSCPEDLKPYLEASWHCVKVVQGQKDLCSYGYLPVSGPSGYIASIDTQEYDMGSSNCPWVIKVLPGQRINVTLLDFGLTSEARANGQAGGKTTHPRYCREYATLRETKSVRSVVVCDGDPVQKHMYISDDHVVEIEVEKSESPSVQFRFLLRYQVIGCPLPEAPPNTHIEGTGNQVYVRCNFTSDAWILVCSDGQWTGSLGNCTQGSATQSGGARRQSHDLITKSKSAGQSTNASGFLPLGITVVIIVGVAMFICLITLVVGLLHLRRKRRAELARKEEGLLYGTTRGRDMKLEQQRFATVDRSKPYSPMGGCVRTSTGGEYTQIWEVRRPVVSAITESGDETPSHQTELNDCPAHSQGGASAQQPPIKDGVLSCSNSGTLAVHSDFPCGKDSSSSLKTFKPSHSHIYNSPKADQCMLHQHAEMVPFYFELDTSMVCEGCMNMNRELVKHAPPL